jgi:hypothetical protein
MTITKYDNVLIIGLLGLVLAHVTPPGFSKSAYSYCAPIIIWVFFWMNAIDLFRFLRRKK